MKTITTAQDLYMATLSELRKEHTRSMPPDQFNYHANVGTVEYIKTRWWAFDKHQKHIDDLSMLIVQTHGVGGMPAPLVNAGPAVTGQEYFTVPYDDTVEDTVTGKMFLINVRFQLKYDPAICNQTTSKFLRAEYRRHETVENDNYYYKPVSGALFYQQYDRKIWRFDPDGQGDGVAEKAMISYLRYPRQVEVDETTGASIVNPETDFRVNIEIAKWIAQSYLENIESYRLQTMQAIQSGVFNQIAPQGVR